MDTTTTASNLEDRNRGVTGEPGVLHDLQAPTSSPFYGTSRRDPMQTSESE